MWRETESKVAPAFASGVTRTTTVSDGGTSMATSPPASESALSFQKSHTAQPSARNATRFAAFVSKLLHDFTCHSPHGRENAADRDVSVIEGVMGYYDGLSLTEARASTCEVAQWTETPAVLVVDARGASRSVLAVIHGFLTFAEPNGIRGVILNRCTAGTYAILKDAIAARFGGAVLPLGGLLIPRRGRCRIIPGGGVLLGHGLGLLLVHGVSLLSERELWRSRS